MPPPPVPVAVLETAASRPPESSQPTLPDSSLDVTKPKVKRGRHTGRHKAAGFKPIGQISAIRKFFPTDDDDVENPSGQQPQNPASPSSQVAAGEATGAGQLRPQRERGDEIPSPPIRQQESSRMTSPPRRDTNASLRDDLQPMREAANGSWKTETTPLNWPVQLPDQEGTRPASPSGESPGELYTILSQVGEGTFGKVYKARNTVTRVHVALKRIRMEIERDGFPVTAMREIKLLQSLRHGNVVRLYEMMVSNGSSASHSYHLSHS